MAKYMVDRPIKIACILLREKFKSGHARQKKSTGTKKDLFYIPVKKKIKNNGFSLLNYMYYVLQ